MRSATEGAYTGEVPRAPFRLLLASLSVTACTSSNIPEPEPQPVPTSEAEPSPMPPAPEPSELPSELQDFEPTRTYTGSMNLPAGSSWWTAYWNTLRLVPEDGVVAVWVNGGRLGTLAPPVEGATGNGGDVHPLLSFTLRDLGGSGVNQSTGLSVRNIRRR